MTLSHPSAQSAKAGSAPYQWPAKTIALVGIMGAGKSTVGKRLAKTMGRRFVDSDAEIERASGLTIADIFLLHGEAEFRRLEQRIIARLAGGEPCVLATGGGAYMNEQTRDLLRQKAVTVWLDAAIDVLWQRVTRRNTRPLLKQDNPRAVLEKLLQDRAPVYGLADIKVISAKGPHYRTVDAICKALNNWEKENARSHIC